MQNYSKPQSGVTTFGSLYALLSNTFDTLLSQFSGTSFPGSPTAGQPCYRTDRLTAGGIPKLYIYSGNPALGESGWCEPSQNSVIGEEVINARGTKPTLDQRLDVALNEDGTLKASTTLNPSQWYLPSLTFTYVSTTSFTVNGDQRDIYKAARRLKINLGASTVYSEVVSATYSTNTTVQILDAVLDNTLVSVEHSLLLPDWDGKSAISPRMAAGRKVKTVTGNYTTTLNDEIILVDSTSGAIIITVLAAASLGAGRRQEVIKISSDLNAVTVDPNGSETINGLSSYTIATPATGIEYESDGTNLRTRDDQTHKVTASDLIRDFVVTGLLPSLPGATLTMTIPVGIAYVMSRRVVKLSGAADLTRTYTASKDTYVDLSVGGAITYSEVSVGGATPAIATNSLRLIKVTTNGSQVTTITDLRSLTPGVSNLLTSDIGSFLSSTLPTASSYWYSIAYGNGRFVAVSATGTVAAYSKDGGATWTSSTLPASQAWYAVAFGNGKFVAVGASSTAAYSSDGGATWSSSTMPASLNWWSVAFGNGTFVAVSSSTTTTAAYSTNGTSWSSSTMTVSTSWQGVAFGNGVFIAVDGSNNSNYSTNGGVTWNAVTMPTTGWSGIAFGNGRFVAVSSSTAGAYSINNGLSWTSFTLPSYGWSGICYGNGIFCAVGSGTGTVVAYSLDAGATWTSLTLPTSAAWKAIAYGNGRFAGVGGTTVGSYAQSSLSIQ